MSAINSTIEVFTSNINPGSVLTKFIGDHLKISKNVDNDIQAPKCVFISKANSDKKTLKKIANLNEEIKSIKLEIDQCSSVEERELKRVEYEKKIDLLNSFKNEDLTDTIDITKFEFISELNKNSSVPKPEEIIDKIYDAELRGFLDIAQKTEFKQRKGNDIDPFKLTVDHIGFTTLVNKHQMFAENINKLVQDLDKFRIKVFNFVFTHPIKEGKDRATYLLKSYKKMDSLLKYYVEQRISSEKMFTALLKEEFKSSNLTQYQHNFTLDSLDEQIPIWIKELKIEKDAKDKLKQIHMSLKSSMYFYKFLNNFDYNDLKTNYPKYMSILNEIKQLQIDVTNSITDLKEPSVIDVITIYINILRKLRKIDPRPNTVYDKEGLIVGPNNVKLDNLFTKDLNNIMPFKFSKSVKERIRHCVDNDVAPKFIDPVNIKSEDSINNDTFFTNEFTSIEDSSMDIYNKDLYAKIGMIAGLKLPKTYRIAIGMRCVTEVFRQIERIVLQHKNRDNFTIIYRTGER
jgi:hypothetical protein